MNKIKTPNPKLKIISETKKNKMNKCREPTSKHFVHELFKHAFNDVNIAMGIECSKQFVKDMLLADRNICKYSQQVELLLFNIDRLFHHNPSGIPFCFKTTTKIYRSY